MSSTGKRSPSPSEEGKEKPKAKAPRLYHTKSRKGCQRCRERKVKCNETRPICGNCHRHGVSCIYKTEPGPQTSAKPTSASPPKSNPIISSGLAEFGPLNASSKPSKEFDLLAEYRPTHNVPPSPPKSNAFLSPGPAAPPKKCESPYFTPGVSELLHPSSKYFDLLAEYRPTQILPPSDDAMAMDSDDEALEIPEGRERRLLELRLQQNFIEKTSRTLTGCHRAPVVAAWAVEVPKLALSNDNVLYSMLAFSALHLLQSEPDNKKLLVARDAYRRLTLRKHRRAITMLSPEAADAACYTTTLVSYDVFACLQDRPLNPWTPPSDWVMMVRGSGSIFGAAFDKINNFRLSKIMPIVVAEPNLMDVSVIFADSNRKGLEYLLTHERSSETWDDETEQGYKKAVNYIGGVRLAVDSGEEQLGTLRRLLAFGLLGPRKYFECVCEYRPRALVILAHFFAIFSTMEDIWWVGNVARREVEGIQQILPPEWHGVMKGPLTAVGLLAS